MTVFSIFYFFIIFLQQIQERLFAEKANDAKLTLNSGFVVFKSIKTKELALKSTWNNETMSFINYPAPQPSEINWRSLKYPYTVRYYFEALYWIMQFSFDTVILQLIYFEIMIKIEMLTSSLTTGIDPRNSVASPLPNYSKC